MGASTRKQREIEQRERRILQVGREMAAAEGYLGVNMDKIAARLEYSKGTIYNHFSCKEEILIALLLETMERRLALFQRAAVHPGGSRQRMQAVGVAAELFVRLHPDHFLVEQMIRSDSLWLKTSEQRRNAVRSCEIRCMETVGGLIREAVSRGELQLPGRLQPEELVFGLWSMTDGAYRIIASNHGLAELGVPHPFDTINAQLHVMLDGYGWRPLSSELDYEQLRAEIREQVFADEWRRITF